MQRKYLTIFEDLTEKIKADVWPVSTMLPSENHLTEQYQTSRETIRKALDLLAQKGYIQKIQGKGSIVLESDKFQFPVSGIESYTELTKKLKWDSKTRVHEITYIDASHELRKRLSSNLLDSVWKVVRSREVNGEKIILDKDYFSEKHVPLLTKQICEHSIYDYIENELGLVIGFAQKEFVVEPATEEDDNFLDLSGFTNLVVIKSHVYLDDATLFQYTESRHRPDKFRFVDFARRVKN